MPSVALAATPDDPSTAPEQPDGKPMTKTSDPLVSLPLTDAEPLPFATRWNRSALPLVAGQASVLLPAWVFQSVA